MTARLGRRAGRLEELLGQRAGSALIDIVAARLGLDAAALGAEAAALAARWREGAIATAAARTAWVAADLGIPAAEVEAEAAALLAGAGR